MDVGLDGCQAGGCLSENEASDFVRGALPSPHIQAVEAHLDGCALCLEYVAALARVHASRDSAATNVQARGSHFSDLAMVDTVRTGGAVEIPLFSGSDRFRVLRHLGSGGMGVVYEALDTQRGTRIALKLLPARAPDALMRFKNEFHSLQDIQHPNLLRMGELYVQGGQWFFTMELVDGVDFLSYVRLAPLLDSDTGSRVDEARLRAALHQLTVGL